jgi:nicotinamidase-related amidase
MKNVLVVIDLQVGFINDKTVKVANNIRDLLDSGEYSAVIATKFTNMPGSSFDSFLSWRGMLEEVEKELLPFVEEYADCVISKCSYSCVNINFIQSLVAFCGSLPEEVTLVGVDTDACVLATAIDLFEMGIKPIIIEDCVGSSGGDECHEAGMLLLKRSIGKEQIVKDYGKSICAK